MSEISDLCRRIEAAGERSTPSALAALMPMLDHGHPLVVESAIDAIAPHLPSSPEAVMAVRALRSHPSVHVRVAAGDALQGID